MLSFRQLCICKIGKPALQSLYDIVDSCMSNVTAVRVDEDGFLIPNPGDQGTTLPGVAFTENSEDVLLHQVFNYVRIGWHRVIPLANVCL